MVVYTSLQLINLIKVGKCENLDILGDTIESCSVYLFPFIIEYSMIGGIYDYDYEYQLTNK